MDVSKNRVTPKSSILIGFSIINHPFSGTPIFGLIPIYRENQNFPDRLHAEISDHRGLKLTNDVKITSFPVSWTRKKTHTFHSFQNQQVCMKTFPRDHENTSPIIPIYQTYSNSWFTLFHLFPIFPNGSSWAPIPNRLRQGSSTTALQDLRFGLQQQVAQGHVPHTHRLKARENDGNSDL